MQQFSLSAQPRFLRYGILGGRITLKRLGAPLICKAIPTAVGFAFGDCLTQYLNKPREEAYDWSRTAKMGALGAAVAGPIGLWFFRWMNANLLTQGPAGLAMGVKVLLDQVLGCILWQAAFLSIHEPYRMAAGQLIKNTSESLQGQTSSLRKRILPAV
ncbi:hypothetical protein DUNSADRAFT_7308 [Dunaliella salina]|uniref:Uncharacterized protein n=1 Tax=Dunaliella salina TaxID=3046 RepID=A0ABQ7GLQ5_DUNSA|nr:hypothetical protein DUNSADRAFT_7308 [Dunaliella salina]|eukprot:KAF5835468.1 hypothetical protein DUNSADRAFT_7308 [Dunaliella salina]